MFVRKLNKIQKIQIHERNANNTMKKTYQRFARGLAACLLVTALAAMPVFAGSIGENGIDTSGDNIVAIGKDLAIYNDGYNASYSPEIMYTYSIKPATVASGTKVKDSNNTVMAVSAGIGNAVEGYNTESGKAVTVVGFSSAEQKEASEQKLSMVIRKEIVFTFDLTKFTAAGVYRYEIKDETQASVLARAGVIRPADYEDTKYLDVYVVKATDSTTGEPTDGYSIAGYVLLDENVEEVSTAGTEKDPGFRSATHEETEIPVPGTVIPGDPAQGTDDVTVTPGITGVNGDNSFDYYYTYNLEVDKAITGNMADTTHQFPFEFVVSNPGSVTVGKQVYVGTDASALAASTGTVGGSDENGYTFKFESGLANNGKYYIYGINPLATVNVKETNDTANTYKARAAIDDASTIEFTVVNADGEYSAPAITAANITGESDVLKFENNLDVGTPTGVMTVAAPFAAVALVAGGAFGLSKIKSKKKDSDAE